jgi:hypothetical protein
MIAALDEIKYIERSKNDPRISHPIRNPFFNEVSYHDSNDIKTEIKTYIARYEG